MYLRLPLFPQRTLGCNSLTFYYGRAYRENAQSEHAAYTPKPNDWIVISQFGNNGMPIWMEVPPPAGLSIWSVKSEP